MQQTRRAAGAQFALTGPHAYTGATAQIEQIVDRQIFHRVLHFARRHCLALTHQAAAQTALSKPDGRAIAVSING
ncbi:hypothetical protein D3C76_1581440 [compost metagenome]